MGLNYSRSQFQNFSDNSTMHGFHDLYYAKSIFWKCIWLLLIFTALGISIFQLINLVKSTIDEPTTTIIKPLSGDISYPPLTICYVHWIYWVNWTRVVEAGFDKSSALYGLGFLSDVKSSDWFNLTMAKEKFISTMKKNGFKRVSQFYNAIANDNPPGFEIKNVQFHKISIYSKTLCYVASSEMIESALSKETNGKREIGFTYTRNHFIPDEIFMKTPEYEAYILQMIRAIATENIPSVEFNISRLRVSPEINVDGTETNWIMLDDNIYATHITVSSALNIWLNNGNPKCNDDENSAEHYNYCDTYCSFREYTLNKRSDSCISYIIAIYFEMDTIEDICERDVHFLNTSLVVKRNANEIVPNFNTTSFYSCIDHNCMIPCKHWQHTSTINVRTAPSQLGSINLRSDSMISYPGRRSILEIIQVQSQSWETLVGNVGGIVGLWLGASVMSIIQMVYLLCCGDCDNKLADVKRAKVTKKNIKTAF